MNLKAAAAILHHAQGVKRIHFIKITINYHNKMQNTNSGTTIICGREVNKLKLATAMIQLTPVQMALKLMACMFSNLKEEIVNGTPTGTTTSKDERRIRTVKQLDPAIMQFIEGQ